MKYYYLNPKAQMVPGSPAILHKGFRIRTYKVMWLLVMVSIVGQLGEDACASARNNEDHGSHLVDSSEFLQLSSLSSTQQQLQEQFIGNALWAVFDVITFGAFESKDKKKKKREAAEK